MSSLGDIITQHGLEHIIYADDVQLMISTSPGDLPQAVTMMESCIEAVHKWLCTMRLTLNASKTEVILLGNKKTRNKCTFHGIHVDGALIVPTDKVRSLGVIIDDNLTMESHVTKIRSTAFSRLHLIARVRKSLRPQECTLLVKSLVVSNTMYCASLLAGVNTTLIKRLQQVINSSVRLIHGIKKGSSIDTIVRSEGWLPMDVIIKIRVLSLMFTVIKHGKPVFLHSLLLPYQQQRQLRSQDQQLLVVPRTHLSNTERAFRINGPRLWNMVPLSIRAKEERVSFIEECTLFFMSNL
jgi:hypothetical protein